MQARPVGEAVSPVVAVPLQPDMSPPTGASFSVSGPGPAFRLRHDEEFAWLSALAGLSPAAASVLAARSAASFLMTRGFPDGANPAGDYVLGFLCSPRMEAADGAALLLWLSPLMGAHNEISRDQWAEIDALWPLVASAEQLLASGGDERLALNPETRTNKYGCTPWPRDDVVNYGSCTASSLSGPAFAAVEGARRRLAAEAAATSPARALADASERIAAALLDFYGVGDLAEAVLAASGTDAALVVTGLLAAEDPRSVVTSVLVSPSETGSGVPNAVQGRHFAACAPSGHLVGKGEPIDGLGQQDLSLVTVALRDEDGAPRPAHCVIADMERAIEAGLRQGRVVLHAIDGSKTGLTAPCREDCRRLAETYGPSLDIVIDACQARLEPAQLRWYLEQGFPVLVTGSKFFAAPGFCGAVLFPRRRFARITAAGRLPSGLASYARLQGGFGSRRCPGLVLRWTAALTEMGAFAALRTGEIRRQLQLFGDRLAAGIARDVRLRLVGAPRPAGMGWSDCPSVFTFAVWGADAFLSASELRPIYEAMARKAEAGGEAACQIGQPVELGSGKLGGLRLALSAPQVVRGAAGGQDAADAELTQVFAKLSALLDATPVPG